MRCTQADVKEALAKTEQARTILEKLAETPWGGTPEEKRAVAEVVAEVVAKAGENLPKDYDPPAQTEAVLLVEVKKARDLLKEAAGCLPTEHYCGSKSRRR